MRLRALGVLCLLAAVSAALPLLPSYSQEGSGQGFECQRDFGKFVGGIGSRSQTEVHYRLLVNRFHAPASRGPDGRLTDRKGGCREDVQGLVSFRGESDDEVIRAMLFRKADQLNPERRYLFYGLGRPLTPDEKYRIESEVESGQSTGVPFPIYHLPLWIEGVAVAYNLNCQTGNPNNQLWLTSQALSDIFSGIASRWNHGSITARNLGLVSCEQTIRPVVRAEADSVTQIFKDYLAKRNPQWKPYLDKAMNTRWPPTLLDPCRALGDEAVGSCVAGLPGAIGYLSFQEAFERGLMTASLENRSLAMVGPTLQECTDAGDSLSTGAIYAGGPWHHVSLTDPERGYSICRIQYGLAFGSFDASYRVKAGIGPGQVRTVKDYFKWAVLPSAGCPSCVQSLLVRYNLAKLPENLRAVSQAGAEAITLYPEGLGTL